MRINRGKSQNVPRVFHGYFNYALITRKSKIFQARVIGEFNYPRLLQFSITRNYAIYIMHLKIFIDSLFINKLSNINFLYGIVFVMILVLQCFINEVDSNVQQCFPNCAALCTYPLTRR